MAKAAGKSKSVETIMTQTESVTAKSVTEAPERTHRGTGSRPSYPPTTPTEVKPWGAMSSNFPNYAAQMADFEKEFPAGTWGMQSRFYDNPEGDTAADVLLVRRPWRNNKLRQTEVMNVVYKVRKKGLSHTEYFVGRPDTPAWQQPAKMLAPICDTKPTGKK